jgi:hypothetical protein
VACFLAPAPYNPAAYRLEDAMAASPKVRSLNDAVRWLDALEAAAGAKATGAWPLASVLDHLAQSVEMSMEGFPQAKSELFQKTAGSAAFAYFKWRGAMNHGLAQAIPGAPALTAGSQWQPAAQRLRAAIARFDAHEGALKPHFAYGPLAKGDYALAHALHIANHQDEILLG